MTDVQSVSFTTWAEKAACKGMVHIFYSNFSERPTKKSRREQIAKAICKNCPVIENCKQYAHSNPEYGIWGGESEEERFSQNVPIPAGSRADNARRKRLKRRAELDV